MNMYGPPVDAAIYEAIEQECGEDFAFSYLTKARQHGKLVEPFTHIGWTRLRDNHAAAHTFRQMGYQLKEPVPFYPGRDNPKDRTIRLVAGYDKPPEPREPTF